MLTAIKTMTPTMSTIFFENIDLLHYAQPHPAVGENIGILERKIHIFYQVDWVY
jgi:hypothetical protein